MLEAVNTLYRMNELSALGRKVRAQEHRLQFVREEHGPAVETVPAYKRADAALNDLQEEWQNELEDRDAWRSLEEADSIDELLAGANGTADE
jgi:antirestriction protein